MTEAMTKPTMVTDSQAVEWREDLEKVATTPLQIPRQAVLSPEQVALALLADRERWKALAERIDKAIPAIPDMPADEPCAIWSIGKEDVEEARQLLKEAGRGD